MGNTLEQHRAAIGGFAARQLSHAWANSAGVFKPSAKTEEKRKKPQGRAKAAASLVTKLILLGFSATYLTMACPVTVRGTSSHLSASFKPTMPATTMFGVYAEVKDPDPGHQVSC